MQAGCRGFEACHLHHFQSVRSSIGRALVSKTRGWEFESLRARQIIHLDVAKRPKSTGSPAQTPLMRAIGKRNAEAVTTLVRLGANTSADALHGRDLFDILQNNGLSESIPAIQQALMEARIARAAAEVSANAPATPGEDQAKPVVRRRRLDAV